MFQFYKIDYKIKYQYYCKKSIYTITKCFGK